MRKPQQTFDLEIPDDYKLASVLERDRADFESTNIWFYVGADYRDSRFAKVGITMGDLRSRSYRGQFGYRKLLYVKVVF